MPESTTMSGITHSLISEVYITLFPVAKSYFQGTDGLNASQDVPTGQLIRFLEGYHPDLSFDIKRPADFSVADEELEQIRPYIGKINTLSLKSINVIDRIGDKVTSRIIVNSKTPLDWHRFCYIKEACHVIIALNERLIGAKYALDDTARHVWRTAKANAQAPFSIFDFDDPRYPASQKIENAAEVLACLILVPIHYILEERHKSRELNKSRQYFDAEAFAKKFYIPEHYASLLLSEFATGFVDQHVQNLLKSKVLKFDDIDQRYWTDEHRSYAEQLENIFASSDQKKENKDASTAEMKGTDFGSPEVDYYPNPISNKGGGNDTQSLNRRLNSDFAEKPINED